MPLGFARITNLLEDPKEREAVNQTHVRWWVMQHARRLIRQFEASVEREQLIPLGHRSGSCPNSPRWSRHGAPTAVGNASNRGSLSPRADGTSFGGG